VTRLFQMLVDRLGHLKHIQLPAAKNGLQLFIRDDFALILRILKFVLLDVRRKLVRTPGYSSYALNV
jgi:hypothetical protein